MSIESMDSEKTSLSLAVAKDNIYLSTDAEDELTAQSTPAQSTCKYFFLSHTHFTHINMYGKAQIALQYAHQCMQIVHVMLHSSLIELCE